MKKPAVGAGWKGEQMIWPMIALTVLNGVFLVLLFVLSSLHKRYVTALGCLNQRIADLDNLMSRLRDD